MSSQFGSSRAKTELDCVYHPKNPIYNFCCSPECLLPMCATCVGIHALEHHEDNTIAHFANIFEVVREIKVEIQKSCSQLQQYSQMYTNDYKNKEKMADECKVKLADLKQKIVKQIQNIFSDLELKMLKKIDRFDEKMHEQYKGIEDQIQYLYESLKLKLQSFESSDKLIKTLILYKAENQSENIKEWLDRFYGKIHQMRKKSIRLRLDPGWYDLITQVDKFIELSEFEDNQNEFLHPSKTSLLKSDRSAHQK